MHRSRDSRFPAVCSFSKRIRRSMLAFSKHGLPQAAPTCDRSPMGHAVMFTPPPPPAMVSGGHPIGPSCDNSWNRHRSVRAQLVCRLPSQTPSSRVHTVFAEQNSTEFSTCSELRTVSCSVQLLSRRCERGFYELMRHVYKFQQVLEQHVRSRNNGN